MTESTASTSTPTKQEIRAAKAAKRAENAFITANLISPEVPGSHQSALVASELMASHLTALSEPETAEMIDKKGFAYFLATQSRSRGISSEAMKHSGSLLTDKSLWTAKVNNNLNLKADSLVIVGEIINHLREMEEEELNSKVKQAEDLLGSPSKEGSSATKRRNARRKRNRVNASSVPASAGNTEVEE